MYYKKILTEIYLNLRNTAFSPSYINFLEHSFNIPEDLMHLKLIVSMVSDVKYYESHYE